MSFGTKIKNVNKTTIGTLIIRADMKTVEIVKQKEKAYTDLHDVRYNEC